MNLPFTNTVIALHPDWKAIATRAWSMRFAYASAIYSGVDAAMSLAIEGRVGATLVVFFITVGMAISRTVHQPSLSGAAPAKQDAAE
jgi:hypothetical protein